MRQPRAWLRRQTRQEAWERSPQLLKALSQQPATQSIRVTATLRQASEATGQKGGCVFMSLLQTPLELWRGGIRRTEAMAVLGNELTLRERDGGQTRRRASQYQGCHFKRFQEVARKPSGPDDGSQVGLPPVLSSPGSRAHHRSPESRLTSRGLWSCPLPLCAPHSTARRLRSQA